MDAPFKAKKLPLNNYCIKTLTNAKNMHMFTAWWMNTAGWLGDLTACSHLFWYWNGGYLMKIRLLLVLFWLYGGMLLAQPVPPGERGSDDNQPTGSIGSGLVIMLALGAGYGAKKVYQASYRLQKWSRFLRYFFYCKKNAYRSLPVDYKRQLQATALR